MNRNMNRILGILALLCIGMLFISCTETSARFDNQRLNNMSTDKYFIKGKMQLETMGYINIKPMDYPLFCCAETDSFFASVGFIATTQNGEIVKGCFCVPQGIFKNAVTIRFD